MKTFHVLTSVPSASPGAERVSPLGGVRWQRGHSRDGVELWLLPHLCQHARRHAAPHRRQGGIPGMRHVSLCSAVVVI